MSMSLHYPLLNHFSCEDCWDILGKHSMGIRIGFMTLACLSFQPLDYNMLQQWFLTSDHLALTSSQLMFLNGSFSIPGLMISTYLTIKYWNAWINQPPVKHPRAIPYLDHVLRAWAYSSRCIAHRHLAASKASVMPQAPDVGLPLPTSLGHNLMGE